MASIFIYISAQGISSAVHQYYLYCSEHCVTIEHSVRHSVPGLTLLVLKFLSVSCGATTGDRDLSVHKRGVTIALCRTYYMYWTDMSVAGCACICAPVVRW